MQGQDSSIIDAMIDYVKACPYIIGDVGVDLTAEEPVNYDISPAGMTKVKSYITGGGIWQYNCVLQSREFTVDDASRQAALEFTEKFIFWIDENSRRSTLPTLPPDMFPISVYADNGVLLELDENGDRGIYQVQLHLLFERI